MNTAYTEFSWMSDEEVVAHVNSNSHATPMENELAARLAHFIDYIVGVEDDLATALASVGDMG